MNEQNFGSGGPEGANHLMVVDGEVTSSDVVVEESDITDASYRTVAPKKGIEGDGNVSTGRKKITRRGFLEFAVGALAVVGAGSVTAATFKGIKGSARGKVEQELQPNEAPGASVDTGGLGSSSEPASGNLETDGGSEEITGFEEPTLSFHGFPSRAQGVEMADGKNFRNFLGSGTEMMLAEPGALIFHEDELALGISSGNISQKEADAMLNNPQATAINEHNSGVINSKEAYVSLPEGGFTSLFGDGEFYLGDDRTVEVHTPEDTVAITIVRAPYGEGGKGTDENSTIRVAPSSPGHFAFNEYRNRLSGGFVSEDQVMQQINAARSTSNNSGRQGALKVVLTTVDVNTGAYNVVEISGPNLDTFNVERLTTNIE